MRELSISLFLILLIGSSASFANHAMNGANVAMSDIGSSEDSNMNCKKVVEACKSAHYTEHKIPGKNFWQDCMKPLLLGKSVTGVSLSSDVVKACRHDKIEKMKNELNQFESIK